MIGHAALVEFSAEDPDPGDWRHRRIEAMVASVEGCASITWRVMPEGGDVLVVEPDEAFDSAAVMARLGDRAPLYGFRRFAHDTGSDRSRTATPRFLSQIRTTARRTQSTKRRAAQR